MLTNELLRIALSNPSAFQPIEDRLSNFTIVRNFACFGIEAAQYVNCNVLWFLYKAGILNYLRHPLI